MQFILKKMHNKIIIKDIFLSFMSSMKDIQSFSCYNKFRLKIQTSYTLVETFTDLRTIIFRMKATLFFCSEGMFCK